MPTDKNGARWVCVPEVPTAEMLDASSRALDEFDPDAITVTVNASQ